MTGAQTFPCRKCGAPNPSSNQYCRKCGAVLLVATAEVRAQKKPVLPAVREIRWRWAFLGAFITLGLMALLLGAVILVAWAAFKVPAAGAVGDLDAMTSDFMGMTVVTVAVFLAAFGLGGAAVSWISKTRLVLEPIVAAFVVLILLAVIGSVLTEDMGIVAGVMLVPAAAVAALGGRLGGALVGGERKK